jgi:spore germination protein YaaH
MLRGRARKLVFFLLVLVVAVGLLPLDSLVPGPAPDDQDLVGASSIRGRVNRPTSLTHQVYGYLPYWQLNNETAKRLDYRLLSTIAFFGIGIKPDGNLDKRGFGYAAFISDDAIAVTNAAHAHGVRVVPTFQLFGWYDLTEMKTFLADEQAQDRFIAQAVKLVAARKADGANLDFEPVPEALAKQYVSFVAEFRAALRKKLPKSTLVVALEAGPAPSLISGLNKHVDQIFMMAYDYRTTGSDQAGPVAPIDGQYMSVRRHLERFLRYTTPDKLILGVPYYGYDWPVTRLAKNAPVQQNRKKFGKPYAVTYSTIAEYLTAHPSIKVERDSEAQTPYFTYKDKDRNTYRQVWYEDARSIGAKYDLAIEKRLAGIGIWALGNDGERSELWTTLRKKFAEPGRKVAMRGTVFHLSRKDGIVRADLHLIFRNTGKVPERGRVDWVIRDARGKAVLKGHLTMSASAGRTAKTTRKIELGRHTRLVAGTYTFQMTYRVFSKTFKSAVFKFKQRY